MPLVSPSTSGTHPSSGVPDSWAAAIPPSPPGDSPLRQARALSLPLNQLRLDHTQSSTPRSVSEPNVLAIVSPRLGRKMPPKLTESLELLAHFSTTPPASPRSIETATMSTYSYPHKRYPTLSSPPSTVLATPTSSLHGPGSDDRGGSNEHIACAGRADSRGSSCTWSFEEFDQLSTRKKETRREKSARKRQEKQAFDVDTPPTTRALYDASLMEVIAEDGTRVKFGDLVRRGRTIVIFIRHWYCPLCAQYMRSIVNQVPPEALEEADVELVIIGNGSDKMLPSYKNKAFKCPYKMYTDPSLSVYRALGLTRQTANAGPDDQAGDYLVQSALESTLSTLKRATLMPLRYPGHFTQLGGEFVFQGTLNVSYTHRMTTTRSHAPIRDVCAAAGVRLEWLHYEPGPPPPPVHRPSVLLHAVDEEDWEVERDRELERIRRIKENRRAGKVVERVVGGNDSMASLEELRESFGHLVV